MRTLEDYHSVLEKDNIPVFRGYKLNFNDELRREVITQLICHFRIEYQTIEDLFKINFKNYFSDELKILKGIEKDDLLQVNSNTIEILPAGRFLIRNICSVFDIYLDANKSKNNFSKMI
jgi:oxygen-independent coproporphyrinogen-3 oxidase